VTTVKTTGKERKKVGPRAARQAGVMVMTTIGRCGSHQTLPARALSLKKGEKGHPSTKKRM